MRKYEEIRFHLLQPAAAWLALAIGLVLASPAAAESFAERLSAAAIERTRHVVRYDGSYHRIDYPMGDVPAGIGVCTDVVIRAFRALGIDLQQRVHEDMRRDFRAYPQLWGLSRPDRNIDHRRVPNLRRFFERHGESLGVSDRAAAYRTGDLVTWRLPHNLPHIGIVVDRRSRESGNPLIVHNIGQGPKMEDVLFEHPITGHYRYPADGEADRVSRIRPRPIPRHASTRS